MTGIDDYHEHDPVEVWHQLVGEYVQPMEPSLAPEQRFRARMHIERMGPIEVINVTATPYVVHRSRTTIARGHGPGQIFCSLQVIWPHLIIRDGQERIRYPGELVIFDPNHPCTLVRPKPVNFLAFIFPRQAVGSDLDALVQGAATVLPTDEGIGALVTSFFRQLGEQSADFQPATAARLAGNALDLLSTFFADLLGTEPSIGKTPQRSLVLQVKAYIEEKLADPGLSSATVAAAHHISIRHLQKLFESQGLTVSGWIRERRLECVRRDLFDPAQDGVSITVIADRWRFADSAHFSRVQGRLRSKSPGLSVRPADRTGWLTDAEDPIPCIRQRGGRVWMADCVARSRTFLQKILPGVCQFSLGHGMAWRMQMDVCVQQTCACRQTHLFKARNDGTVSTR